MARASARDNRRCAGLILIGNPGIGKSCLLNCVLIRLLKEGKTVCVCVEDFGEGSLFRDRRCRWCDKDALPNEVKYDAEAFQLFDPSANGHGPTRRKPFCVIAASPRKENWHGPYKSLIERPLTQEKDRAAAYLPRMLHAPRWEKDEMIACSRILHGVAGDSTAEGKYLLWGGVLRDFFGRSKEALQNEVRNAARGVDISLAISELEATDISKKNQGSHKVFRIAVPSEQCAEGSGGISYDFTRMTIGRISDYAEMSLRERLSKCASAELISLRSSESALHELARSFRGLLFEAICHSALPDRLRRGITAEGCFGAPQRRRKKARM
eukprot:Plantae.Rhodophyta-Hildenbrandia_rubra.ctg31150.p1 GENE.Plantae.Rhodophyta-Hildenbrandia_rubra.ctg31150~~Plantae.Rhodophyta-Hildenbrandia_rubra.ctg31150.p1  ORF type:complete len:326 (-),score=23.06 Plantae.Rhodophyta-Hildenbrandia_rubra.ctg31150:529-1506(-)